MLLRMVFFPSPMPGISGDQGKKRLIPRRFQGDNVVVDHGNEWLIVAFANHSRKSRYWRDRTSG